MTQETRAGLVAVLFVVALVGSILFLRGGVDFRDRGYDLYVVASNAGGVAVGAPIHMAGVEIGRVSHVELTPDYRAQITVRIRPQYRVPIGSRFAIGSAGLLGDRFIVISPEPGDVPSLEPGTIVTATAPFTLDELVDRVVAVARRAEDALISINRLVGDPEFAAAVSQTVRNARDATEIVRRAAENVERTTRTLDRTMSRDLPAIAAQIRIMSAELAGAAAEARGLVRDVAADGETARQIRLTIAAIQRASAGVDKMVRDLQGLINETEVAQVRASLDEARRAITEARQAVGEGRALIGRADQTVQRIQQVIPEKIELPSVRNAARLEYGLWYDGRRLGNDVLLTLQPESPTNFLLSLREFGGVTRWGIQVSNAVGDRMRVRYGLIDSNLGVGLDYRASPQFSYAADLYNINQVTLNVYVRYALNPNYGLSLRGLSLLNQPTLGIGAYYRF
ncbi:MAG: MlaD family protein [Armatimonadota bacterium]|nr:MlaD family protein [Armatimonadota bacterium]